MNLKRLLYAAGLVILLIGTVGAGWMVRQFGNTSVQGTSPESQQLTSGHDQEGVVCFGFVDLEHGLRMLTPLRPGRIAEVCVKEGQSVVEGAALLRLEDIDAKLLMEEADRAVDAAQAQYEQAVKLPEQHQVRMKQQQSAARAVGFRLAAARELLKNKLELQKDKIGNAADAAVAQEHVKELESLEQAERDKLAELKLLEPELAVRKAKSELDTAKLKVKQARRQIDECTVKAPSAGVVQRVLVDKGDVMTGNPAQPAIQFCPAEPRLIRAEVDQEFADRVWVGQSATIKDDARAGTLWRGKVARVGDWFARRRPNPQEPSLFIDVRTVECLVTLDPDQPALRIGQRMRVMLGPVPGARNP